MASSEAPSMTVGATAYLVNHVVLPPKLPQKDDYNPAHEQCLIDMVILALEDLREFLKGHDVKQIIGSAVQAIVNLDSIRDRHGHVSELELKQALQQLSQATSDVMVPLEIKAQNAGLLVYRRQDSIVLEPFELSPTNKAAMSSVGRLVRTFPASASKISASTMQDGTFCESLSCTITKLSTQAAPGCQPQVRKNGHLMEEDRDTTAPTMVSQWLMSYIAAYGGQTNTVRISKNTREEVLWDDCRHPWRRSPLWLLIRVTLQLLFTRSGSIERPLHGLYKAFVAQLLSRILQSVKQNWEHLGSEYVYLTNAKLARRLRKLETLDQLQLLYPQWASKLEASMVEAHAFIDNHWKLVSRSQTANIDTELLCGLQPGEDLDLHLSDLDAFLAEVAARSPISTTANFKPDAEYPIFSPKELPINHLDASGNYKHFRLLAFEAWVESNLDTWLSTHIRMDDTCCIIRRAMQTYYPLAQTAYADVPASLSIMYLSLLELWVASDKSACTLHPLLCQYDPELRLQELQCLVLPLKSQRERLVDVESYVKSRRDAAIERYPSVFQKFGDRDSFAVRYFDQCPQLQTVLQNVLRAANLKQSQKHQELLRLKDQYSQSMDYYNNNECETMEVRYGPRRRYARVEHASNCRRCAEQKRANSLKIQIYEWPLSSKDDTAKATIFECHVPRAYGDWRDTCMFLSTDVLGFANVELHKPKAQYTLDRHNELGRFLSPNYHDRRIIPLSSIKGHINTHRKLQSVVPQLQNGDVCLDSALDYAYFDKSQGTFTGISMSRGKVVEQCMYRMSDPRSKVLERYLCRPPSNPNGPNPNEVMASLSDCPAHFSLEEYKAFGLLPLGCDVVYLNILTQLATHSIDFAKPETQTLILQVIDQCGVGNDTPSRVNHRALLDESFCCEMLEQLELSLRRVSENWEAWRAAATFVAICLRILSLTPLTSVRNRSLAFLAEARQVSLKWLSRLKSRANASTEDDQRTELYSRATEVALLCIQTLDVEDMFLDCVLQQKDAISALLQSSIMVQENCEVVQSDSPVIHNTMLRSWRSLLYRAFVKIRTLILKGNNGLDTAVLESWAGFRPAIGAQWSIHDRSSEHWLEIKSGRLMVYFNLLTAELLVNGLPLARLPREYTQHEVYGPLFGKSIIEVVPTDWPGMSFSIKTLHLGYKVQLGMGGVDMHVNAVKDGHTYDLLPSRLFKDHIPQAFETDYTHWYNHDQSEVHFRARGDPWSSKNDNWRLVRKDTAWRLVKDVHILANASSKTARTVSDAFRALEDPQHIHIMLDTTELSLHISLPRLQLDFYIEHRDSRIQSRQYRGMIVDPCQTTDTLVGLTSKLVLAPGDAVEDRQVLIPVPHTFGLRSINYGRVSNQDHTTVKISKNEAYRVFAYSLDSVLGRIVESGDVQRVLFLALLHALTSYCLPDLLTGCTGTESALQILQSAAVRSFENLTAENVETLHQIATLAPRRSFYPEHLKDMQQVEWNKDLPSLAQHPQLRACAEDIIQQARMMQLFYPDQTLDTSSWETSNSHLEERYAVRSSTFRVYGFGADAYTPKNDIGYNARDVFKQSSQGQRAYIMAMLLLREQDAMHTTLSDFKSTLLQKHFNAASVEGCSSSFDPSILKYDAGWLLDPTASIVKHWCNLHHHLPRLAKDFNKHNIVAWLSTMAFANAADMCVLQAFVAFYRLQILATVKPPTASVFELSCGNDCASEELKTIATASARSFDTSAEAMLPKQFAETDLQHIRRIEAEFRNRRDQVIRAFVNHFSQQWPRANPSSPTSPDITSYINVLTAIPQVLTKFQNWYRNRQFSDYIQQTYQLLLQQDVRAVVMPPPPIYDEVRGTEGMNISFHVDDIFAASPPNIAWDSVNNTTKSSLIPPREPELPFKVQHTLVESGRNKGSLEQLCGDLQNLAQSKCEGDYVRDLRDSCASLDGLQISGLRSFEAWSSDDTRKIFQEYLDNCKNYFSTLNQELDRVVEAQGSLSSWVGLRVQHSPRISQTFWLSQLHRDRFEMLPESWKSTIIAYGLAVTQLHRAQRLFVLSTKPADLMEELGHVGHSNWSPREFPETLLLEAESGILIRREQEFIASHMRDSQDTTNIVLQLLMGGGKSSTIVPILAAYLSDKKKLVRIIVAKPQSKQMLHMLVSKLGYLLNRRIYHMPFSRSLRPDARDAALIRHIYEDCIAKRGVLLIQPEHILSFKLMAVEAVLADQACARSLLETQAFFDRVSRDIVDESDENFSVKFELIYTIGSQRSVDFAPERWLMIQAIVGLIPRYAKQVEGELPNSIDIQRGDSGRFPRVRTLRDDASRRLLALIARHVVEFGISGLPTHSQPPHVQAAILRYITETDLTAKEKALVEGSRFWNSDTKSPMLLVRGLIAGGILHFALSSKRWRVNFGLDPTRVPETPLAVPFRSKDCPSPRSEFSHPDVVIILSLLSYYYGGLTDEQLFDSFAHIQKSDQGDIQYAEWVHTASPNLPKGFHQLSGVSIKDRHQCVTELFPELRFSKKAIDYYLSSLVFPKVMKEFPQKLSASGWDIGAVKTHPVTGFSGTNDTSHTLPLTVKHLDLPSQSHTNALVLQYLLQDENSVQPLPPRTSSGDNDAKHLLALVIQMEPEIRVLLDCGASILDQNNQQVAETWLKMRDSRVQAVVFFNNEELSVLDREGRIEPLQTSPFAKQLDVCLIYLDEAHTRGTDLKLPRDYRAAVTLGQGLVKDKLTQGCMRMRKLGVGQSVVFIVPEEISTKIQERTRKPINVPIGVGDVLCWSITETWQDLKRSMPLWAVQGERFERNKDLLCGAATTFAQAEAFLEDEAQTLEARYKPHSQEEGDMVMMKTWDLNNKNITDILTRCKEFGAMNFGAASLSEEQEREMAPEIEKEIQIERPAPLKPEPHHLHPDVLTFVSTGQLNNLRGAFRPAFQSLSSTSAASLFELGQFPTELFVTEDFQRTVKAPTGAARRTYASDSYQRPVHFILSVPDAIFGFIKNLVIISSWEANRLLPDIRDHREVTLHVFAPRTNAAFASLDELELYNVGREFFPEQMPRSLTVQLNLFTGSLYLRSFAEYTELCDFLGLLCNKPVEGQHVYPDGFIYPPTGRWGLKQSPVPFLRTLLMKIRREGEGIEKTHLGKILSGVRLEEADFGKVTELDFDGDTEMSGT